jgi:hypothetical protein
MLNKIRFVVMTTVLVAFTVSTQAGDAEKQPFDEFYNGQWSKFLAKISKGDKLADAKELLADISTTVGVQRWGGTGNASWVFRIDDFSEVEIAVDREEIVADSARFRPLRKWRRFPDGQISEAESYQLVK